MKKKQYFDETAFNAYNNKAFNESDYFSPINEFKRAVETLKAEGLDVSLNELKTYPSRFKDFDSGNEWDYRRHFNKLCDDALKRSGWLPNAEKERIRNNFMAVCKATEEAARTITSMMKGDYVFTDTENGVEIDIEATEEARRSDFIHDYDADLMAEHYKMLQAARESIAALNGFNAKHGIPKVSTPGMYDFGRFAQYILQTPDLEGNIAGLTEEQHEERTWEFFKIKK